MHGAVAWSRYDVSIPVDILRQRRLTETREYRLLDDVVQLTSASMRGRVTASFPLAEVQEFPTQAVTKSPRRWLLFAGIAVATISLAVSVVMNPERDTIEAFLLFAFATLAAWLFARRGTVETLLFRCGTRALVFLRDRPSKVEFERFLVAMQERRHAILRAKIAATMPPPESGLTAELERLHRLRERSALTQGEYDFLKRELIESLEAAPQFTDEPEEEVIN